MLIWSAGISAAFHVGKLPPALPTMQHAFGITLLQASFLVSAFQLASMSLGIVGGMLADRFGPRRVMLVGLVASSLSSLVATFADSALPLMLCRALESAGFLLSVLPGPALLRRLVPPGSLHVWLGRWGAYMPLGMGLALVTAPWLIDAGGWRAAWAAGGAASMLVALLVMWRLPADPPRLAGAQPMVSLIRRTVSAPGPWLLALGFGCYAAIWMGVFSFLPTVYHEGGIAPAAAGTLTAIAVLVNIGGNLAAGWLVQHRVPPPLLMVVAASTMAAGAWVAFGTDAVFAVRYLAVLMLSMVGGLLPGSLFSLAPRLAPDAGAVSTTTGLMQQGSSLGQSISAPVLAALASASGGWQDTWKATLLFAVGALLSAALLHRLLARGPRQPG